MSPDFGDDFGMSAAMYMAAMLFGIVLFIGVPLYLASRPTEIKQSTVTWTRIVNREKSIHAATRSFPVAKLKRDRIIEGATIATLAAKSTEASVHRQGGARASTENDRRSARARVRNHHPRIRRSYVERAPKWRRASYPDFAALF